MLPLFSLVVVVSGKQLFVLLQVLTRHIRYTAIMLNTLNLTVIFASEYLSLPLLVHIKTSSDG